MFVSFKTLFIVKFFFALSVNGIGAQTLDQASSDFERHSIVRPVLLHGRTKREISTTRYQNTHHPEVTLKVPIAGEEYILDLRLNQEILPENYVLSYQENGKTVQQKPKAEEIDLCHYGGLVRDKPGSWAAVSTCHGVQGAVFDGERMRYIEPVTGGDINAEHYVYDHADLVENHPRKWANVLGNPARYNSHQYKSAKVKKPATYDEGIDTYPENERSLYVELVLVADNRHFEAHRRDLRSVHLHMTILANILNSVFSQLNIYIVLVGVEVWSDYDRIPFQKNSSFILDHFLKYRRNELNIPNDNAHLVTLHPFDGSVIGSAFPQTICTEKFSAGIAHNHSKVIGLFAMTIAHEMGHNFGMEHDEDDCKCEDEKCIMSFSSTSTIPEHWSTCSLSALATTFSRGLDICLRNKPNRMFYAPFCGNGIVEEGEDCDCGTLARGGYNPCHACCDPESCRLRTNASCGAGECCDLQSCRIKSKGTKCRSATTECDLPEYCTGQSNDCPENLYKMDTTPCGKNGESAYCVNGVCRSHSDQCRILWGPTGKSCDSWAYGSLQNTDCGYDRKSGISAPCSPPDVMCGRLHCSYLSHPDQRYHSRVGSSSGVYITTVTATLYNRTELCYSISVDLGKDVADFGMVPDGAECGEGMMCLKQRCVSVMRERDRLARDYSSVCPSNCSGQGVCNSKGDCHCNPGFVPPLCDQEVDSSLSPSTVALLVIFLGIVPAIFLILLAIYYWRPSVLEGCMKKIPRPNFKFSFTSYKPKPDLCCAKTKPFCVPSETYANVEAITIVNAQNENNTPSVIPPNTLKRPKPLITHLPKNIQPKVQENDIRVILKPRMNAEEFLKKRAEESQPNIQDVNSGNRIKPALVRPKPFLNKPTEETRSNVEVCNKKDVVRRPAPPPPPPPIRPKPNVYNSPKNSGPNYKNVNGLKSATNGQQNK